MGGFAFESTGNLIKFHPKYNGRRARPGSNATSASQYAGVDMWNCNVSFNSKQKTIHVLILDQEKEGEEERLPKGSRYGEYNRPLFNMM